MTTAWIVAYVVLAVGVALTLVLQIGFLKRVAPLLESQVGETPSLEEIGLNPGTAFEPFSVVDDSGDEIPWPELVHEPTVLILTSESCGACREMIPKLRGAEGTVAGAQLVFVTDSFVDPLVADLRTLGRVVFDPSHRASVALANRATPQAFVVHPAAIVMARGLVGRLSDLERLVAPALRTPLAA